MIKSNQVLKTFILATSALFLAQATFAADATMSADNQAIASACSAEAQAAGCGSEVVGKGLLKCIGAYKKAQGKAFKISSGCRAAMHQRHADKKAGK